MTWLTWRQFRVSTWVALAALAATAVGLLVVGIHLAGIYADSGLATCASHGGCDAATSTFLDQASSGLTGRMYDLVLRLTEVAPALIGVFWGAPLISRELESGTFRLAWNQSVTRGRWLAAKLALVGGAAMTTAGLFSLMATWYSFRIDQVTDNHLNPQVFAARGIAPIGYAAFAFALGVTAGLLIRHTVPAMAVTLLLFTAVQVVVPAYLRPHLIPPVQGSTALNVANLDQFSMHNGMLTIVGASRCAPDHASSCPGGATPGAWVLSNRTVTPAGTTFTGPADPRYCDRDVSPKACLDWIGSLRLRQVLTYQPASRFWPLQWYETGIFLAVALLLCGFSFWWVRRRLT